MATEVGEDEPPQDAPTKVAVPAASGPDDADPSQGGCAAAGGNGEVATGGINAASSEEVMPQGDQTGAEGDVPVPPTMPTQDEEAAPAKATEDAESEASEEDEDEEDEDEDEDEDEEDEEDEDEEQAAAQGEATEDADEAGSSEAASAGETADAGRVHSVFVVLPEGFEGIPIDVIFDDMVQARIYETCRRSLSPEAFRKLWPRGRRELLESVRRGVEEHGRGAVAHGLAHQQAQALANRLAEFVTAQVGIDREAAARATQTNDSEGGATGSGDRGTSEAAGEGDASSDANSRVHSVYFVLPVDMQGMLDFILPEIMPRLIEVCRRHREYSLSWPSGPGEMERALRQGVEESGRGPLLHGLRLQQAEALREQLGEFIEAEVVCDREAAQRLQERERRNRPPPRSPPAALLARFLPGSRVRITTGDPEEIRRLQQGYGDWSEKVQELLGTEGTVTAYAPAKGHNSWSIKVACTSESQNSSYYWNPANLQPPEGCAAVPSSLEMGDDETSDTSEEGEEHDDQDDQEDQPDDDGMEEGSRDGVHEDPNEDPATNAKRAQQAEVLLANDEDLLPGDNVLFHNDGRWYAAKVAAASGEETFRLDTADGRSEDNVPRRHILMVVTMEQLPEPIAQGAVVRITDDAEAAKRLQRSRWSDSLRPCLGQLGVVVEARDRRRLSVSCPAAPGATTWNAGCLTLDKEEGLRCLDLHKHPLWWCASLSSARPCAGPCGRSDLQEAYCCLHLGPCEQIAVCAECAKVYLPQEGDAAKPPVRSRHHICELRWAALPAGPQKSCWPCAGAFEPGGCRGVPICVECSDAEQTAERPAEQPAGSAKKAEPVVAALSCANCEYLLCGDCEADPSLGLATEQTRKSDVAGLPETAPRVLTSLRSHPSEIFALAEAGLFVRLASCLGDNPSARCLALDLCAWLSGPPPACAKAGPALADAGGGIWAEGVVVAEDREEFDGTWTDESDPGKWLHTIEGNIINPPVAGSAADADRVLEVSGCGIPAFDGLYIAEGAKNGKVKFRKASGGPQTCNYSNGSWYLCHHHAGSWYQAPGYGDLPPSTGWEVGGRGRGPAPTVICGGRTTTTRVQQCDFKHLPSVGTWLQARLPHDDESAEAEDTSDDAASKQLETQAMSCLAGTWRREVSGDHIVIVGTKLSWPDGDTSKITSSGDGSYNMEFQGQVFSAKLVHHEEKGNSLEWNDGDVWVYTGPVGEPPAPAQLREGQHVSYRGFSRCIVKEVLSEQRVALHIPGVGYEEAVAAECTPCAEEAKAVKFDRLSKDALAVEIEGTTRFAHLTPGGRLVWSDRGGTWVRREDCPCCPAGHLLCRTQHSSSWHCDECTSRRSDKQRLRCEDCDYDICENCLLIWRGLAAEPGLVDAWWRYVNPNNIAIGIRTLPDIEAPRDGQLQHGEVFRVSEHREGADGVLFLRLADGRGWVFNKKPGVGTMCELLRVREERSRCDVQEDDADVARCTVAWADIPDGVASAVSCVPLHRVLPAFGAPQRKDGNGDFLKSDLLQELGRGARCERLRVQSLLDRNANVLGVEGGVDVLSTALRNNCDAAVLEALLVAGAPVVRASPSRATAQGQGGNAQTEGQPTEATGAEEQLDVPLAILALQQPRLTALLEGRGGARATTATDTQEKMTDALAIRPKGSLSDLLQRVGRELLTPLLQADTGEALEPCGWLGSLLRALGQAGYELSATQIDKIAAAVAAKLAQEPDDLASSVFRFVRLLLDVLDPTGKGSKPLSSLQAAFHRHGVSAALKRLADSVMASWPQRNPGDPNALRRAAQGLTKHLTPEEPLSLDDGAVGALIPKLPSKDALHELIGMLRSGECTPYELGIYEIPRKIQPIFESPSEAWPWTSPAPLDAKSTALLASKLQTLLGMCENFPVAALTVREDGLNGLLQPHVLALEGPSCKRELRVESLLPLRDLERFVLQTAPVDDKGYLEWCENICGTRIAECPAGAEGPWRAATVVSFNLESKLPVHLVRHEDNGSEELLLLHLRRVVCLNTSTAAAEGTPEIQEQDQQAAPTAQPHQFGIGCKVQAKFEDGCWYRATIEREAESGGFIITWENGTQKDTQKKTEDMRPLPGKAVCHRVQVTQDGAAVAGVAVWEHASGAQDVVDQHGRFLVAVPSNNVVPEARHARDSPGRPMPFEIRNLPMPERGGPPPVVSLERSFSAVDRHYRPRDFQYKNPARKIGGPEGEPLQTPDPSETSASGVLLNEEVASGKPAPCLRVRFFGLTSTGSSSSSSSSTGGGGNTSGGNAGTATGSTAPSDGATTQKEGSATQLLESEPELPQHLTPNSTVLQALLKLLPGGLSEPSGKLKLRYEIKVETSGSGSAPPSPVKVPLDRCETGLVRAGESGASSMADPVLALLRRLRRHLQDMQSESKEAKGVEVEWENGPLNRKLAGQLAQPLLTAAVAAPPWVLSLPLAYPFLFERRAREQLLRCAGFGTSHAVLWLQRQSIEERYGDRLRRVEGQLEGRMDLTETIVRDPRVFVGPARSDFITLPSRDGLLVNSQRVVELTYASKAMLEVKFADEGGFGDGVTQSFYTAVASELTVVDDAGPRPLCGSLGLWAEHLPSSVSPHGTSGGHLHSRRGLFPRPNTPGSPASVEACRHFRFLGRLMAKALRDGFVVPLPLCEHFFCAVLEQDPPIAALPGPGDGWAGEFVGASARFAVELRRTCSDLEGEERRRALQEASAKPDWGRRFLGSEGDEAGKMSFDEYVQACCINFCETGVGGQELCEGGKDRSLDIMNLDEFVESAARWWLRDGIAPQVAAFRQGVEDACASSAIWAFEPSELRALFCGDHVEWSPDDLKLHLRARGGVEAKDMDMLVSVLHGLNAERRGRFLDFVTACPRLPPGGLAAADMTVVPANPPGSLPRARTCTKELRLPKYESAEQLEQKLILAIDSSEGLYDDDRMT